MSNGQAYQRIYNEIGLDNVVDFKDIAFANKCGAQWNIKGDMSDLPKLFKTKNIKQERIDALNEIARDLEKVKLMVIEVVRWIKNSISKEVIIEKIEEKERELNDNSNTLGDCVINQENIMKLENQIEILQELLEVK